MAPQYSNEHGNRVPVAVVHHENLISHADVQGSLLRKDPYGTPVERAAAGAGHERHRGILHRSGSSSSSSSSSSEGDGQGGRRKKSSLTGKIKEKLPGGRKNGVGQTAKPSGGFRHTAVLGATTTTTTTTTATANGGPREKKGFMEKIKEKLPGHH